MYNNCSYYSWLVLNSVLVIQGVKKVRRHYTIGYNFSSNDHSILKLHRFQELFNIKVATMLQLLQSYFIIIKLEVYTHGVQTDLPFIIDFTY